MTQCNDVLLGTRVDGAECSIDFAGVFLVHHHGHAQAGLLATQRPEYLKTSHVCAHQKNALAIGHHLVNQRLVVNPDIKQVEAVIEQVNPVMNRRGKTQKMTEQLAPAHACWR